MDFVGRLFKWRRRFYNKMFFTTISTSKQLLLKLLKKKTFLKRKISDFFCIFDIKIFNLIFFCLNIWKVHNATYIPIYHNLFEKTKTSISDWHAFQQTAMFCYANDIPILKVFCCFCRYKERNQFFFRSYSFYIFILLTTFYIIFGKSLQE